MYAKMGNRYMPAEQVYETLPTGIMLRLERTMFSYSLSEVEHRDSADFITFGIRKDIIGEIRNFRSKKAEYGKYGFAYKRGYLLHGPAGTGKTALIRKIITDNKDAIAIDVKHPDTMEECYTDIRKREPDRLVFFVIEDIDDYGDKELTQFMDGHGKVHNVIFLATTNYFDCISSRLQRPGRFDRVLLIDGIEEESRVQYVTETFPAIPDDVIKEIADETEGMSMAEIKNYAIEKLILKTADVFGKRKPQKDEDFADDQRKGGRKLARLSR